MASSQIPSEIQWVVQCVSHRDSQAFLRQPNPPITHNDFHLLAAGAGRFFCLSQHKSFPKTKLEITEALNFTITGLKLSLFCSEPINEMFVGELHPRI